MTIAIILALGLRDVAIGLEQGKLVTRTIQQYDKSYNRVFGFALAIGKEAL